MIGLIDSALRFAWILYKHPSLDSWAKRPSFKWISLSLFLFRSVLFFLVMVLLFFQFLFSFRELGTKLKKNIVSVEYSYFTEIKIEYTDADADEYFSLLPYQTRKKHLPVRHSNSWIFWIFIMGNENFFFCSSFVFYGKRNNFFLFIVNHCQTGKSMTHFV